MLLSAIGCVTGGRCGNARRAGGAGGGHSSVPAGPAQPQDSRREAEARQDTGSGAQAYLAQVRIPPRDDHSLFGKWFTSFL